MVVKIPSRIGSDFVPTLRVGIRILYLNLGYVIVRSQSKIANIFGGGNDRQKLLVDKNK